MTEQSTSGDWWRSYQEIGEVSIVLVDLSENPKHELRAYDWLNAEEKSRADRFRVRGARRRFMLCRAALRANLCTRTQCNNSELHFIAGERGKPSAFIHAAPLPSQFNVSHSRRNGLIAFAAKSQLGIDIEHWDQQRNFLGIGKRVFSHQEQGLLKAMPTEQQKRLFLRLWTCKEALIKATGEGMARKTSSFSIPSQIIQGQRTAFFRFDDLSATEWKLVNIESDRFAAALAYSQ